MAKVLIVDDDAEFRENLYEILADSGYQVELAPSGAAALKTCGNNRFDIILLDLIMPGTPGTVALSDFKRASPGSKIIMITAFATIENAVEAMKRGASDFITKPFKINDLLTVIRRVLEEAKFRRNTRDLNFDFVLSSLASPIRRQIMRAIQQHSRMRLMEITRHLEIEDHTKVVFHLRNLKEAGMIDQDDDKFYLLTSEGSNALECLDTIEGYLAR
jgi:DNA-binding NtrC family response regulator